MRAEILSTGEELVLGATLDSNSAWLSQRLSELGIPVVRHTAVGDDLDDIVDALRSATARADLVLMTGGLGPTADDLTREALCRLAGRPPVMDETSLGQIMARFRRMGRMMPPENRVQAIFPEGSRPLANSTGTAPGVHVTIDPGTAGGRRSDIFAMPGVPREMTVMWAEQVLPALDALPARRAASGAAMVIRMLNCFGAGESVLGEAIKPLMTRGRNPNVGTNVKDLVVRIRVTARGATPEEARTLADRDVAEVRGRLAAIGPVVFGEGDDAALETAVGALLAETGRSVAVAEGVTGGMLGAMLTNVPGMSAHFRLGITAYGNAEKVRLLGVSEDAIREHGAVSTTVAEAMAVAARVRGGADFGLAITGIAGPGGGTAERPVGTCVVALADAAGAGGKVVTLLGDRDQVRDRACKHALNLLRLKLLDVAAVVRAARG